jgi:hypothetical protein
MPRTKYKNIWGSAAADGGIDQQRSDLFKVTINLPATIGGIGVWTNDVEFAVAQFPFPERSREMVAIKYLNQTNHMIGSDTATGPVEIPVRYAFNQRTAQTLEKWHQLTSNSLTGGVALTSAVKANGVFTWLVPNMDRQVANVNATGPQANVDDVMKEGLQIKLEGCLIRGLKFMDANMTDAGQGVNLSFSLQVDRWYPVNINNMVF